MNINELACNKCGEILKQKISGAYSYKIYQCPKCGIEIRKGTGYSYEG